MIRRLLNLRTVTARTVSTLNESEVGKFGLMKNDWWDQAGQNSPLHSLNALRVSYVQDIMPKSDVPGLPLTDVSILDVGCGGGIMAEGFARLGANVTAIDANSELIDVANQRKDRYKLDNLQYLDLLIEDLQDIDKRFDVVISSEVIEHVDEPWAFAAYCSNLVKPDGHLIFTTINRTVYSRIVAIELAERVLNLLPRGTHEWEKFVTVSELTLDLREVKFHVENVRGMSWCPFLNRWGWSNSLDCNYLLHAVSDKKFLG